MYHDWRGYLDLSNPSQRRLWFGIILGICGCKFWNPYPFSGVILAEKGVLTVRDFDWNIYTHFSNFLVVLLVHHFFLPYSAKLASFCWNGSHISDINQLIWISQSHFTREYPQTEPNSSNEQNTTLPFFVKLLLRWTHLSQVSDPKL